MNTFKLSYSILKSTCKFFKIILMKKQYMLFSTKQILPFIKFMVLFVMFNEEVLADDLNATIKFTAQGKCTGSIDLIISGGYQPYEVAWVGPNGAYPIATSNGNDGPEDLNDLCVGTYCVTVTDALCGTATACYEVEVCPFIDVSGTVVSKGGPSQCNGQDGYIFPRISRATINGVICTSCVFHLEDSKGNNMVLDPFGYHNLLAGYYNYIATDENGCTGSIRIELIPDGGFYTISTFINPCVNQNNGRIEIFSISLNDTETFTYNWNTGFTDNKPWGEPSLLDDLGNGHYCVTITSDLTNCVLEECFDLQSNPAELEINESIIHPCPNYPNGRITINPVGGTMPYSYIWENGSAYNIRLPLGNGTYCVTVTDYCGLVKTKCYNLVSMDVQFSSQILCYNQGEAEVIISHGNSPYKVILSTGSTSNQITGLGDGTYWVKVTDNNNCSFNRTFNLNYPRKIYIENIKYNSSCNNNSPSCDGDIDLNSTDNGHYTYSWTGPDGFSSQSEDIHNLCPGIYHVTVTDDNGCYEPLDIEICCCSADNSNFPTCPNNNSDITYTKDIKSPNTGTSPDGYIKLTVSGGNGKYYYNWTGPNNYSSKQKDVLDRVKGTYCLTITDGCHTKNECIELKSCEEKNIQITGQIINTCSGYSYGAVTITINGEPVQPLKYIWSNGRTDKNLVDVPGGQYCVTVTDNNDCTATNCFTVGYNSLTPTNVTIPCRKEWRCNGNYVGADPYPLDCGYYNPSNCREYICYCTLTGEQNSSNLHNYIDFQWQPECNIYGRCPSGQWEFYTIGNVTEEYVGFDGSYCVYAKVCRFQYNGQGYYVVIDYVYRNPDDRIRYPFVYCSGGCVHDVYCGESYIGSYCGNCPALTGGNSNLKSNPNNNIIVDLFCQQFQKLISQDSLHYLVPNFINDTMTIAQYKNTYLEVINKDKTINLMPINSFLKTYRCKSSKIDFDNTYLFNEYELFNYNKLDPTIRVINLYPNPTSDEVIIELQSQFDQMIDLLILDNLGQTVLNKNLSIKSGINKFKESFVNFNQGLFQIVLRNNSGKLFYNKSIMVINN